MKSKLATTITMASLAFAIQAIGTESREEGTVEALAQADGLAHHRHHHPGSHGERSYGRPGAEGEVERTIAITALDSMRYEPDRMTVRSGETVRFAVTNAGKLRHELIVGDEREQRQHAEMMKAQPHMKHDDPNAVSMEPGETQTLIWRFGAPGEVELACHVPGHYEAGMRARVSVLAPEGGE